MGTFFHELHHALVRGSFKKDSVEQHILERNIFNVPDRKPVRYHPLFLSLLHDPFTPNVTEDSSSLGEWILERRYILHILWQDIVPFLDEQSAREQQILIIKTEP